MTVRRIFWIILVLTLMVWEGVGLYYWWVVRGSSFSQPFSFFKNLPPAQTLSALQELSLPASLPQVQIGDYQWPLLHPAVTDISLRLEGILKTVQPGRLELTKNGESLFLDFDVNTKLYSQANDGRVKIIDYQQLQVEHSIEVALSRQADGTFRISTIQVLEE